MPFILVVDDSATDRKLIGGLLKRDIEWLVDFVDNGEAAMQMIEDVMPDLVITDLQMPKLNGIELCRLSREKFPQIPVVLITGEGSEQDASEALAAGAASYVAKSSMAKTLADTVEQILAHVDAKRSQQRLMSLTTNTRHQFHLDTDLALIRPLLDFLTEKMNLLHFGDDTAVRHVIVAVEEALLNAMMHGNLGITAAESQEARHAFLEGTFDDWLQANFKAAEGRRVKFATDMSRSRVQFVIRDEGAGVDKRIFENAKSSARFSEQGGRGLTLIRSFMDEVAINETGNEIRMACRGQRATVNA